MHKKQKKHTQQNIRSYNIGNSNYSTHKIQPWDIWEEYKLNPWDADIVKRVLREKKGESRKLDYQKIIHICLKRISQLEQQQTKQYKKPKYTPKAGEFYVDYIHNLKHISCYDNEITAILQNQSLYVVAYEARVMGSPRKANSQEIQMLIDKMKTEKNYQWDQQQKKWKNLK